MPRLSACDKRTSTERLLLESGCCIEKRRGLVKEMACHDHDPLLMFGEEPLVQLVLNWHDSAIRSDVKTLLRVTRSTHVFHICVTSPLNKK